MIFVGCILSTSIRFDLLTNSVILVCKHKIYQLKSSKLKSVSTIHFPWLLLCDDMPIYNIYVYLCVVNKVKLFVIHLKIVNTFANISLYILLNINIAHNNKTLISWGKFPHITYRFVCTTDNNIAHYYISILCYKPI